MNLNKRPSSEENESDLMRLQDEYLRAKAEMKEFHPSAKVIRLNKPKEEVIHKKQSRYAQAKGLKSNPDSQNSPTSSNLFGDVVEKNISKPSIANDDNVYYPNVNTFVIGKIIEKNTMAAFNSNTSRNMPAKGFPEVSKRNPHIEAGSTSVFAQEIMKTKNVNRIDIDNRVDALTEFRPNNLPSQSYFVTSSDANDIHINNINLLSNMSENEILKEKEKLLSTLNPGLISFIQSKRKTIDNFKQSHSIDNEIIENSSGQETSKSNIDDPDESLWDNDVLSNPNINKWLHFDSLEKDKLEWMKSIDESKKINNDEPYEARFDFNGYLLPYVMEYAETNKSLYHHGEESHRPGYSLSELIKLSRSTVIQQRVMSLNTIAGVLEYYNMGAYNGILEIPLAKLLFVIRFSLDENIIIILEPALKALRNLLYNKLDEASLDALIGYQTDKIEPYLEHNKTEISEMESKESEFKDYHLAEIDIISGLLRTDIIQRIKYILEVVKPSFNCVQYAMQVLIRLTRDSVEVCFKLLESGLINTIVEYFIPNCSINFHFNPSIIYQKPILPAVKLIRILANNSEEIIHKLLNGTNVLTSLMSYVASSVDGKYGLKLQIEAMYALDNILDYSIALQEINSLSPVVISILFKHVEGTDIFLTTSAESCLHATIVLNIVTKMMSSVWDPNENFYQQSVQLLIGVSVKWLKQLSSSTEYSCGHLRILSSVFNYIHSLSFGHSTPQLKEIIINLAHSDIMRKLFDNLGKSSNLLAKVDTNKNKSVENLIKLESTLDGSKVLPILGYFSPIPFLVSLFKMLNHINDPDINEPFIQLGWQYFSKLSKQQVSLCNNWFTRVEVDLIYSMITVIIKCKNITESSKDLLFSVCNKLCYIFRSDRHKEILFLFDNILFNNNWFTAERLLSLMSLRDTSIFTTTLTNIDYIKNCYVKLINTKTLRNKSNRVVSFVEWKEPILPYDWIYMPIIKLYSQNQEFEENKKYKDTEASDKESLVHCCLEWIYFNELCYSDIIDAISTTDRFCRLLCVYLCDNSLFLNKHINLLLRECINLLFKKEKSSPFNFDSDIVGIHNFQDFYTQLVEQFQAVSYGDKMFSACLLVPLAQKHNNKWRKLIWSEYAGALRALDCPEDMLCYYIDDYLYPEETDISLLESYHKALVNSLLRPCTIPYKLAIHHLDHYKKAKILNNY